MNEALVAAVVTAFAAILAAVLTVSLTKRKEREAAWRSERLKYYEEFIAALSGIVASDTTPDNQRRFTRACNILHLIAPTGTIHAMHELYEGISQGSSDRSLERHDVLVTRMIEEIRRDIGVPLGDPGLPFKVRLFCSGSGGD